MKRNISSIVQALVPPIFWNQLQRWRGLPGNNPWREFGQMITCANSAPLLTGRFATLYDRYRHLDPSERNDRWLYRIYNVCFFANLCRHVPGDFACAGVSWGVAPRIVYDFVDFEGLGKTLHLIDPFEGVVSNDTSHKESSYNIDPDYVVRQYPDDAPIQLHRARIPMDLKRPLAFVFTDTGNPEADAAALPAFYRALNPGAIFITEQYANSSAIYSDALDTIGSTPLWLPSGQGVIFKR